MCISSHDSGTHWFFFNGFICVFKKLSCFVKSLFMYFKSSSLLNSYNQKVVFLLIHIEEITVFLWLGPLGRVSLLVSMFLPFTTILNCFQCFELVLLSAHAKRVSVSSKREFYCTFDSLNTFPVQNWEVKAVWAFKNNFLIDFFW